MANGRTITKTRTRTTTRTATAVALGTVGLAAIAAAALGLNFREMNALTPPTGSIPRAVATVGGTTAPTAPIALGTGTTVNLPRPTVGTVPTTETTATPVQRSQLPATCGLGGNDRRPDLLIRSSTFGPRDTVVVSVSNTGGAFTSQWRMRVVEILKNGTLRELSVPVQMGMTANGSRSISVPYDSNQDRTLEFYLDSENAIQETNECNNMGTITVELI